MGRFLFLFQEKNLLKSLNLGCFVTFEIVGSTVFSLQCTPKLIFAHASFLLSRKFSVHVTAVRFISCTSACTCLGLININKCIVC